MIFSPSSTSGVYRVAVEEKNKWVKTDLVAKVCWMRKIRQVAGIARSKRRGRMGQITAEFTEGASQNTSQRTTRWTSQINGFRSRRPTECLWYHRKIGKDAYCGHQIDETGHLRTVKTFNKDWFNKTRFLFHHAHDGIRI